ncbi:MAG: hypothetical protein L3J30_09150 [Marinosulfonomonas sp.]|nr:hypothetical protein [Marinosulfonomonas sp.]
MSAAAQRIQRVKKNAHENDRHSGCSQGVLLALQDEFASATPKHSKPPPCCQAALPATAKPAAPCSAR